MMQVERQLRHEGLQLVYQRVPLSRNRPPAPVDLQELHNSAFAGGPDVDTTNFVVMSKSASTSTSCAFVAHFLELVLDAVGDRALDSLPLEYSSPGGLSPNLLGSSAEGCSPEGGWMLRHAADGDASQARTRRRQSRPAAERVSNSTISNVCRHVHIHCLLIESRVLCLHVYCYALGALRVQVRWVTWQTT
jgi:hypothetical protein